MHFEKKQHLLMMIECELCCGVAGGWSDVTGCRCILGQVWHGRGGAVHRGAARQTLADQGDVQTQPAAGPQASNQSEPQNKHRDMYINTNTQINSPTRLVSCFI